MGILSAFVVISINLACVAAAADHQSSKCECDDALINRRGFPQGFIFGSASAAYQVEGAYKENGKGPTMWDHFTHKYPDKILDQSNGDVAIDSYNLYKKDVQIAKDLGIDAYRFSISWPRILPGGRRDKGVNQDGIDYYNNLIDELLAIGVEPFVTIFHFDTPQALEDEYGGFLSTQIVTDFKDFAEVLFENFGDRVKHWITINEPWCVSNLGYALGVYAPGRCSDWLGNDCVGGDSATEPYIVSHNQILAHAAVVNLYRNKYQKLQNGKIGIALNTYWFEPYNEANENLEARDRALDFMFAWFMEPLAFGRYPYSMRARVGSRLPVFSKEESGMVKGSFDFIGLNYYSGMYAKNMPNSSNASFASDSGATVSGFRNGIPIGEQGSNLSQYFTYPKGLREILRLIKQKYNDPLIYITENGIDEARNDSLSISEAVKDVKRKNFFHDHLCCLHQAIEKDNANVKGYFVWSMADNFEWSSGYSVRFGIYYVDFNDKSLTRYPKHSALWFKRIIAESIRQPESVISDH